MHRGCAGSHTPQESDEAIKYKAPFVLPWIVVDEAMANQPESFVPFTAGSQGMYSAQRCPHSAKDTWLLNACLPMPPFAYYAAAQSAMPKVMSLTDTLLTSLHVKWQP